MSRALGERGGSGQREGGSVGGGQLTASFSWHTLSAVAGLIPVPLQALDPPITEAAVVAQLIAVCWPAVHCAV